MQRPHPPVYISASSPEGGEFAARHRLGVGFAFTTVPLAAEAVRHYRERAAEAGWEPAEDQVLYRVAAHLAESDEQALQDLEARGSRPSYSRSNRAIDDASAGAGYYGRDAARQRARLQRHGLRERIGLGQLLAGSPDTVLAQARAIHEALRPGVLEVVFEAVGREKTLRAVELFGTRVLPCLREL